MKQWLSTTSVSLGAIGVLAACGAHAPAQKTAGVVANDDGGGGATPPIADAGGPSDAGASAPPQAYLRVAQLSPDLPPIDVCVASHGTTTFQGPLVGQLAGALDDAGPGAVAPGLGYAQVGAYLALVPGQYDVRIVAAGALSCSVGDSGVPDATNLPALAFNTYSTLLLAGESSPVGSDEGLTVRVVTDDAVITGGAALLRAVNAVPSSPALDLGLGSDAGPWAALLTDVAFAAASAQVGPGEGAVDSNGYLPIAPLSNQAVSFRASEDAGVDVAVANSVEIDVGAIATLIAIGGKTGDLTHPPALLLCVDNQPSGGLLSDCSIAK
jgi:hypothetical protein